MLRLLAEQRWQDRQNKHITTNEAWEPSAEQLTAIRSELATAIGRLAIINNIDEWFQAAEIANGGLYPHQVDVFSSTIDVIKHMPPSARNVTGFGVRGRHELPTGSGKSVLIAKLAEAMGIGQTVGEQGRTLRGLVLTSRTNLRQQLRQTFAEFTPEIPITSRVQWHKPAAITPAGIDITTYAQLRNAHRLGQLQHFAYDVIFLDELHNTLGEKIKQIVSEVAHDAIVLGCTASPKMLKKDVRDVLPHLIYEAELMGYIQAGILKWCAFTYVCYR